MNNEMYKSCMFTQFHAKKKISIEDGVGFYQLKVKKKKTI